MTGASCYRCADVRCAQMMELSRDSIAPSTSSQKGSRSDGSGKLVAARGVIWELSAFLSLAGRKVLRVVMLHRLGLPVCGGPWWACAGGGG